MEKTLTFLVSPEDAGIRLDKYLGMCQKEFSRSYLQKLIENGAGLVNGRIAASKEKTASGDTVCLTVPQPEPLEVMPEDIPLDILYEGHLRHFGVGSRAYVGGHGPQTCHTGGAPAPLARYDLVFAVVEAAQRERLYDA